MIAEKFEDRKAVYFTFFIYNFTSLQEKENNEIKKQCITHAAKTFSKQLSRSRETIMDVKLSWEYPNLTFNFQFHLWQAIFTCIPLKKVYILCYYYFNFKEETK